jgi:hypothetical protein
LAADYDVTTVTGAAVEVLAQSGGNDVLLAHESPDSTTRTVVQNLLAVQGAGLLAAVQREKLFKNAVWWLLKLSPPLPFSNLRVTLAVAPGQPAVGQPVTFTAEVQHSGELEASGSTLALTLPGGWSFVSAESESGACSFEDGVVVCGLGQLLHADAATATIVASPTGAGPARVEASVSANQPEAVPEDNVAELTVEVGP